MSGLLPPNELSCLELFSVFPVFAAAGFAWLADSWCPYCSVENMQLIMVKEYFLMK